MKRWIANAALPALVLSLCTGVEADDSRPLLIEVTETYQDTFRVQLTAPPRVAMFGTPVVVMPEHCLGAAGAAGEAPRGQGRRYYHCVDGLSGQTLEIEFPGARSAAATVIRFSRENGETLTAVLDPDETQWIVPDAQTPMRVVGSYVRFGIAHIWVGYDHLLFLLCLLWIAGRWRRIVATVTGFTLAHSLTLALAALDVVRLPVPVVEAVIALSVLFLAIEVAKGRRANLTWRYPIAVSSSFGLLHGLGFAAVLMEIGLPQTQVVTGLLFFNVGVEIGQLAFAALVLAGLWMLRRFATQWMTASHFDDRMQTAMGYSVGCVAAYWLFQRALPLLGAA